MARNKNITIPIFSFAFFLTFFLIISVRPALGQCPATCNLPQDCGTASCQSCPACGGSAPTAPPVIPGQRNLGTFKGLGVLSEFIDSLTRDNPQPAASAFTNFISKAIGVMTVVAFIWFIFNLFIGAIGWLSSGGDKQKLQEAQKKITTNLTGLVIVISAIFLTKIISLIFGIDILNLTEFITTLGQ